jgi:HEAT repeat protein
MRSSYSWLRQYGNAIKPVVRAAAATAAGARADEVGVRMLGSLIQDEDAAVRVQAFEAIPAAGWC